MSIFTNLLVRLSVPCVLNVLRMQNVKMFLVLAAPCFFVSLQILPSLAKATSRNTKTVRTETSAQDTRSRWHQILLVLNQKPEAVLNSFFPVNPSIYSHSLKDNLLMLNQQEMLAIKASWQALVGSPSPAEKRAAREQANAYYRKKVEELNAPLFVSLKKASKNLGSANINYAKRAETALAKVQANSIANLENAGRYDSSGQIGHCFGRALLVHLFLLQAGVPQQHLAKIFNVGQLMVGQHLWRFHVAVMVSDSKYGFLVIDPLQKKPMPYEEWIAANAKYDIKGRYSRARFYVTDPRKFLPSFEMYNLAQLENPVLKPYFDDLVESIED